MVPIIEITSHSRKFQSRKCKEIKTSNQTIKDIGELNEEIAGIAKSSKTNILNLKFMIWFLMRSCKENWNSQWFQFGIQRIAYLLNRLIETEDFLRMDDLSEEVGVSRGTVVKDLKTLKRWSMILM